MVQQLLLLYSLLLYLLVPIPLPRFTLLSPLPNLCSGVRYPCYMTPIRWFVGLPFVRPLFRERSCSLPLIKPRWVLQTFSCHAISPFPLNGQGAMLVSFPFTDQWNYTNLLSHSYRLGEQKITRRAISIRSRNSFHSPPLGTGNILTTVRRSRRIYLPGRRKITSDNRTMIYCRVGTMGEDPPDYSPPKTKTEFRGLHSPCRQEWLTSRPKGTLHTCASK